MFLWIFDPLGLQLSHVPLTLPLHMTEFLGTNHSQILWFCLQVIYDRMFTCIVNYFRAIFNHLFTSITTRLHAIFEYLFSWIITCLQAIYDCSFT